MKKIIIYALMISLGICMTGCGKDAKTEKPQENEKSYSGKQLEAPTEEIQESSDIDLDSNESVKTSENSDTEWKQAYIQIVNQWNIKHGNDYNCGYDLIYIDDNDVPELILSCDDEAWFAYDIYTFIDGKAIQLSFEDNTVNEGISYIVSPGCQGKGDAYIERTGIYMMGTGMMGNYGIDGYVLDGNILKKAFYYFYYDTLWDETIAEPYGYTLEYINEKGEKVSYEVVTDGDEKYYDISGAPESVQIENFYKCDFGNTKEVAGSMDYRTICNMLGAIDESDREKYAKLLYEYMRDNTKSIFEGFDGFSYQNDGGKFMLKDVNGDGVEEMLVTVMGIEYSLFIPEDTWEQAYMCNFTGYNDDGIIKRNYGETFTNFHDYKLFNGKELIPYEHFASYDNQDTGIMEYTYRDKDGNETAITDEEFFSGDLLYNTHDVTGDWYEISEENIDRILLGHDDNERIQTAETQYVTTAADDGGVNMRSGPGIEYDVLVEMIPNGERLVVYDVAFSSTGKPWYKVTYRGIEGWVSASQVK